MGEWLHKHGPTADQLATPLQDRRLVGRMLHHVTKGAAGERLPRLNDVDPWLVGDDWANCSLVRVRRPLEQSIFIVVGTNLLPSRETVLEGEQISRCPQMTLLGTALSFLRRAADERSLVMVEGSAVHLDAPILYRSVLVPLSEDDKNIEAVLIAANSRELREGEGTTVATRLVWSHSFSSQAH
ncbi:MAG TPA: hypothetical protein VGU20_01795 [Stellaceae bacterium]|nr:hypothetical protein [Stellaceae bacterium]